MQGLTTRCQVERTSSEWLPHRTADHRGSPGCAKRYPQSPDHRDALVMHGAAKVRGGACSTATAPTTLMARGSDDREYSMVHHRCAAGAHRVLLRWVDHSQLTGEQTCARWPTAETSARTLGKSSATGLDHLNPHGALRELPPTCTEKVKTLTGGVNADHARDAQLSRSTRARTARVCSQSHKRPALNT